MAKYHDLGQLIEKLRLEAGIPQQLELARLIGGSQQTVSRWELGLSRPRAKQLGDLARVLKCDVAQLLRVAGYVPEQLTTSFAQPFPLHALSPDNFERFCHYLLEGLYPGASVHHVGGTGHTQHGADLEVVFSNGEVHSFQCKRHSAFGAAKALVAINAHQSPASKKVLLLSQVASPAVREVAKQHRNWDVWDVEDLSVKIRSGLPDETQRRLVDTFFTGQRFALLGIPDAGPWQTCAEFFLPFQNPNTIFRHSWKLVGRERELARLLESLNSPQQLVTYVIGKGGGGKTRLLKAALEEFTSARAEIPVWLLSPSAELTQKSLEELGAGYKVLVVDDAHERSDLRLLFQHVATSAAKTRLLLLSRPYGLDFIKSQAVPFALIGDHVGEIQLDDWTVEDATRLAEVVLSDEDVAHLAKHIARVTADCPLATVVGAYLVAKKRINPELIGQERGFRDALLGKFQDVIGGEIGNRGDAEYIRKLLRLVSLVQPVYPEDQRLKSLVQNVEQIKPAETARLFRLLADAGVLLKRAGLYRIAPDLLADFILEGNCVGVSQTSTGYAEDVFDHCGDPVQLEHLLLNLGKLDWRLASGQASNSTLLDGVWSRLEVTQKYGDPAVKAVTAVAFYQPERALNFLESLLRSGILVDGVSTIARNAAYNHSYVERACLLLWELGRNDPRPLNQHPNHPIRVLAEMCAVEPNKPVEYNNVIVEFMLSLTTDGDAWKGHYTPFDVLSGILHTEGHTTRATDLAVCFAPFLVRRDVVAPLRALVVARTIDLLSARSPIVAVKAARFLQQAIRYPMGQFSATVPDVVRESWQQEFTQTLKAIDEVVSTGSLRNIVLIEVARTVSWHAAFSTGAAHEIAKKIIAALPTTLQFRTTLALVDGYGQIFSDRDFERSRENIKEFLTKIVDDLYARYDGDELREFVEDCLREIADSSNKPGERSSQTLLSMLIERSVLFARSVVENSLRSPGSLTTECAAAALAKIMTDNREFGILRLEEYLRSPDRSLILEAAQAYRYYQPLNHDYTERDATALRTCLMMSDIAIVRTAIHSMFRVASTQPRLAISLLCVVDVEANSGVADDVFMTLRMLGQHQIGAQTKSRDSEPAFALLTEGDVQHFLKRLTRSPTLDGYWTQTFLAFVSRNYATTCLGFFFERLDYAAQMSVPSTSFRPINHGPYVDVPLEFRKSGQFSLVVREVVRHITEMGSSVQANPLAAYYVSELFNAICAPFDEELMTYLNTWISASTPDGFQLIAKVLSQAPGSFVFNQRDFVDRFLQKAQALDAEALNDCIEALLSSAVSGVKSGAPGQPFPQDMNVRERAMEAMKEIPRFSPSYLLYERLKTMADENINLSLRQREFMVI